MAEGKKFSTVASWLPGRPGSSLPELLAGYSPVSVQAVQPGRKHAPSGSMLCVCSILRV